MSASACRRASDGGQAGSALTESEIEAEFLKSNAWLKPNMIVVSCRREELLDVRICFGRDLFPKPCGSNEEQRVCRAGDHQRAGGKTALSVSGN